MELIQHMSHTITDFKDFLKEEKEQQPFNVNAAVAATVTLLEAPLKALRVDLRIAHLRALLHDERAGKGDGDRTLHVQEHHREGRGWATQRTEYRRGCGVQDRVSRLANRKRTGEVDLN